MNADNNQHAEDENIRINHLMNGIVVIGHVNNMKNQFAAAPSGANGRSSVTA